MGMSFGKKLLMRVVSGILIVMVGFMICKTVAGAVVYATESNIESTQCYINAAQADTSPVAVTDGVVQVSYIGEDSLVIAILGSLGLISLVTVMILDHKERKL